MQSSLKIKISKELSDAIKTGSTNKGELLSAVIEAHSDQIAYMLQTYYSREKVSQVTVNEGSVEFITANEVSLKLLYVIEEYNACSAVDTLNKEKMPVKAVIDAKKEELNLTGEYWAERDPD